MRFKLTMLLAGTLLLGGCSITTATVGTEVCDIWQPVSWSQKDTPQTISEVKINNAKHKAWCR